MSEIISVLRGDGLDYVEFDDGSIGYVLSTPGGDAAGLRMAGGLARTAYALRYLFGSPSESIASYYWQNQENLDRFRAAASVPDALASNGMTHDRLFGGIVNDGNQMYAPNLDLPREWRLVALGVVPRWRWMPVAGGAR